MTDTELEQQTEQQSDELAESSSDNKQIMTDNTETCPVCGEEYNHFVDNGYRNGWPTEGGENASIKFEVCTPTDSDRMYVHTSGVEQMACGDMLAATQEADD